MNVNYIKTSALLLGMLISSFFSNAQLSEEVEKITPEFPGEVMIDFGFNVTRDSPKELDFNWFRSKSFSAYYIRPMEISRTFSFRPGIGVSLEKLGQKHPRTIDYAFDENNNRFLTYDTISGNGVNDFKKSQIALNHLEAPFEIRYHFGGRESKGIYLGVGGSGAILFESHTKVKYRKFGHLFKEKRKDDFKLTRFRYTAFARFGIGAFGVFYKWHFHDVFTSSGPEGATNMGYSTIGISLSGF